MKIIKITVGSLAALWWLGIFAKLIRTLPYIFRGDLNVSRALGGIAGLIIFGLVAFVCFRSALGKDVGTPNKS